MVVDRPGRCVVERRHDGVRRRAARRATRRWLDEQLRNARQVEAVAHQTVGIVAA